MSNIYIPQQGQDVNFQQFDYGTQQDYGYTDQPVPLSHEPIDGVSWTSVKRAFSTGMFDDEPPLMEGVAVLNPFKQIDRHIMDDTDLAGPLLFCFLFGGFLLLSGKVHFGYIYGIAVVGCLSNWAILNLMSASGVSVYAVASVLGYSLLPIVILSSVSILLQLSGTIGLVVGALAVLWCAVSASGMFVSVLEMSEQRVLVAYPVALFYSAFAMVTIF